MTPRPDSTEALLGETAWLRRLARSLVRGRDLADDVVQETLLTALAVPRHGVSHLRGWLAVLAANVARRWRRSDGARARRHAALPVPESGPDVRDVVERAEAQQRVVAALLRLEEPYRTVLLLRFQGDLGYAAIAAKLSVPVETVRTRIKRGLQRMRVELDSRPGGMKAWAGPLLGVWTLPGARAAAYVMVTIAASAFVATLAWSAAVEATLRREPALVASSSVASASSAVAGVVERMEVDPPQRDLIAEPAVIGPTQDAGASAAPAVAVGEVEVSGRVIDGIHGLPLAGAVVSLEERFLEFVPANPAAPAAAPASCRTDAAGCFRLSVPHTGATQQLRVFADGFDVRVVLPFATEPRSYGGRRPIASRSPWDVGDVVMEPATWIAGSVVGETGEPVRFAEIVVHARTRSLAWEDPLAVCDARGEFRARLPCRCDDAELFLMAKSGDALGWCPLAPAAGEARIRLLPLAFGHVDVVDERGVPVAGARVAVHALDLPSHDGHLRVVAGSGWSTRVRGGTADARGRVVFDGVPIAPVGGSCNLRATAEDHRGELRREPLQPGANALRVVLPRGSTAVVRGIVIDAATSRPVAAARVGRSCVSGADGTFGIADFDLGGGAIQLLVEATGYSSAHHSESVGGRSGDLFVRIELEPRSAGSEESPRPIRLSLPAAAGTVQLPATHGGPTPSAPRQR